MNDRATSNSTSTFIVSTAASLALLAFGFTSAPNVIGISPALAIGTDEPSPPKKPVSKDQKKKKKKKSDETKKKKNFGKQQSGLWGTDENMQTPDTSAARASIEEGEYRQAITQLVALNRPDDANILNLLGYSHRKLGLVDTGIRYYLRALENNPRHKGVHEYLGEAYIQKNDIDKARVLLKKLGTICGTDCLEYEELAATISEYEQRNNL